MTKSLTFLTATGENKRPFSHSVFPFALSRIALSVLFVFCFSTNLSAQLNTIFELDGNAMSVTPNPPDDWNLIYTPPHNAQVTTGILNDMPNGSDNGFVQGTSDIDDVSTWHWDTHSSPDKDNLLHGGAGLYNNTDLFFFGDRFATNGSAQIGFWFFKNQVSPLPNGTFSGTHAVGDILLLSNFVNGGGVAQIRAFEWVGSGGSHGSLDSLTITGNNVFAITSNSSQPSPWPYVPKFGPVNFFGAGGFYEGGLDLAALSVQIDPCFTSFLLETRSSPSVTAELKDFLFGNFYTQPQVSVNSASLCPGSGPATLTATVVGGTAPFTYSWSTGATTSSITVNPSVTTTYTVWVTAANGCQANPATSTVTVNSSPSCSIGTISPGSLICNHGNYTISTTATGTLSWSMTVDGNPPGWGIVGSNTGQTLTFSSGNCGAPGFQVHFTLTVTDGNGCTNTCTADFAPGAPACIVDIRPADTLTCSVTSIWLLASYSTDIINPVFEWALNGTPIGQGVLDTVNGLDSILITAPGVYRFTIHDTANSANDCFAEVTVVQDTASPGAQATGGTLTCTTTSVQLMGSSSTGGVSWDWTGPNGFSSTLQNPMATDPGTYTLTVTNPTNGCTSSATATVAIDTVSPGANATGGTLTCTTTSVQLMGSSSTGGVDWDWTGPNGFTSTLQNPMASDPGTYILTVTDPGNGCTSTATTTVAIDTTSPGAQATGGNLTCTISSVQLMGSSSTGGVSWDWTGPNGFSSTFQNPMATDAGTYTLTVTDPGNGCTSTATTTVAADTSAPGAQASGGNLTCTTTTVQLTGSSSTGGVSWDWTGPNGFSSTLQNPMATDPGTYTLTVTDPGNGCTSTASTTVGIDTVSPGAQASGGNLTCSNTSVQLTGSSSTGGVDWDWTGPNGFTSTLQNPTVTDPGTYTLTVTDPGNGCTSTASTTVSQDTVAPSCSLSAPSTLPGCGSSGNTLTVTASSSSGNVDYSWSVSGTGWSITSSTTTATITYTAGASGTFGTFTVVVTDPNNGCTSSCTVTFSCNGSAGCTPGYWKTHLFQWNQLTDSAVSCITNTIASLGSPYSGNGLTTDLFRDVFGVTSAQMTAAGYTNPNMTMQQAINLGGGGFFKLARHGVAALLSSCALGNYAYTPTQVLTMINNAIVTMTPEPTASLLAAANEAGNCTLNNTPLRFQPNNGTPISLAAYPNPFSSNTTIAFTLNDNSSKASVEIISMTGARVAVLFDAPASQDVTYKVNFDASNYAEGIYFCRILVDNEFYYLKLMVMKQ
jgi:hypothetical protein